MHKFF